MKPIITLTDIAPKFELKNKIKKNHCSYSLHQLVDKRYVDEIDFNVWLPTKNKNLQRDFCWNLEQKRELIKSIFKELFIPNISVIFHHPFNDNSNYKQLLIIDGKQRLSTIIDFLNDKFSLLVNDIEYFFSELPVELRTQFQRFSINFDVVYSYHDDYLTDNQKISWFEQINFAGTPQDIEHLNNLKRYET